MRYLKRGIAVFLVAPMAPSAQPAMAATQLIGEFTLDEMIVPLGEILPMEGYVANSGSGLAQITYQIDGWLGEDDNNRYCTQETWGNYLNLAELQNLVVDGTRAPLNQPGEYTLWLVARSENGESDFQTIILYTWAGGLRIEFPFLCVKCGYTFKIKWLL